jgi:hypothetical protein
MPGCRCAWLTQKNGKQRRALVGCVSNYKQSETRNRNDRLSLLVPDLKFTSNTFYFSQVQSERGMLGFSLPFSFLLS